MSAPAGAARSASEMVENGFSDDPSAGAAGESARPGGPTKSTAGAISGGFALCCHQGGAASQATSRGRTKDQSRTGAVWCLLARHTSDRQLGDDVSWGPPQRTYVLRGRGPTPCPRGDQPFPPSG